MRATYEVLSEGLNLPWCSRSLPVPDQASRAAHQCELRLTRPQMRAVDEEVRSLGATNCRIGSMRGGLDVSDATPAIALHTVGRTLAQQAWGNR